MNIEHEIQELKSFGDALRQDNRLLFEKMMSELEPETLKKASLAKDPFEVVLMALILNQQKMIRDLMDAIKKQERDEV